MIGKIYGLIDEVGRNYVLVRVKSDICYLVYVPRNELSKLQVEQTIMFYIYTHVREQEFSLYGFPDLKSLQIFKILLEVPSIGPKSASNIIGHAPLEQLIEAVKSQSEVYFSQISGVGKKTAQKILLELSSKFEAEFKLPKASLTGEDKTFVEALISLGFSKEETLKALEQTVGKGSVEKRVTLVLKSLNKNDQ